MKFNSIIRAIASALATSGRGQLTMQQRNLVSLLTAPPQNDAAGERRIVDDAAAAIRFRLHPYREFRKNIFPGAACLAANLSEVLFFLWGCLFYRLPVAVKRLWNKNTPAGACAANPRLNFWFMVTVLCSIILAVCYCLRFFVNDLLFFSQQPYSNMGGALVIEQPLHRTHHIYLLNTAEYWSDTGIDITPGDRVYITASGGFFNDILEQTVQAERNIKSAKTKFIAIHSVSEQGDDYKASPAMRWARENPYMPYGTILCRITPEVEIPRADDIADSAVLCRKAMPVSFDGKAPVVISGGYSGRLKFCINDIYFNDRNIGALLADSMGASRLINKFGNLFPAGADTLAAVRELLKKHRDIWYRDNNGEILLNIIVEHSIFGSNDASMSNRVVSGILRPINDMVEPPVEEATDPSLLITLALLAALLLADALTGLILRRK